MSYPALLGVCVSVGSEMLDRERTGYEITQRHQKTCLTTMRKHDLFIYYLFIYLFIYLFPSSLGSGKPISRIPTTILIGWGLCWRSLSFLYGLLKSSLNGVSLDSVTCSIFSGCSSSLVSPGILYFYEYQLESRHSCFVHTSFRWKNPYRRFAYVCSHEEKLKLYVKS